MKNLLVLTVALLAIVMAGATVMADETVGAQTQVRSKIQTMGALGYGIATSQSNPMDFQLIKIGVAGVRVEKTEGEINVKVGVLYFGETKYKLMNVSIGNGTAAADIYDINDTVQKGTISLNAYVKGDREVWAGTLTLDGATYNAYVIQVPRVLKAEDKADDVKEYCKNNPVKCKATIKAVGSIICDPEKEGTSCSEKIKTFCSQNPDDNRCKVLRVAYCKLHMDDSNCRAEVLERCKQNSTAAECDKLVNMYEKYAEKNTEAVKKAPEWMKTVRNRVLEKIRSGKNVENDENENVTPGSGGQ
jgi:hypothetical protein